MRILLVKTSSMGDVIHALPVVDDIRRAHPDAVIDWVVEEAYAELVRLHPGVGRVIPVALRRWRAAPLTRRTRGEWRALRTALRMHAYDAIIDLQGLIKSAWIARLARGPRYGWRGAACREPLAAWLYHHRLTAPRFDTVVAVVRYRQLVAWALGYSVEGPPHYGLAPPPTRPTWLDGDAPYAVLISATARDEKLWDEAHWAALAQHLIGRGWRCVFAWGSPRERERAARIAQAAGRGAVLAPEAYGLVVWAGFLAGARVAVGVDTGLSFLAAAVGTPVVAIYTATSPGHVGIEASTPHRNLGDVGRAPAPDEVIGAALALARR